MNNEDELRELRMLEGRLRSFFVFFPTVPQQDMRTSGDFWQLLFKMKTNLDILDIIREESPNE
jgi:hypothetical protein